MKMIREQPIKQTQNSGYNLREFSRLLVYSPTLVRYQDQALNEFPEHFNNHPTSYLLPYQQLLQHKIQTYIKFTQLYQNHFQPDSTLFKVMASSETTGAFSLTNLLCYPAIEYLGSDEQFRHYSKLIEDGRIVAAYAQTEVGHGSDVQQLCAQATFDTTKQCFVFKTPSLKGIKYWPGALGVLCTHVITQAQLVINGKPYGLQTFILQIRDPKTLKSLKGIIAGDLGPKLGFKAVDNGYLEFADFEAPLDTLLCRYIQIDSQGNVTQNQDKNAGKIAYGSMMTLRGNLLRFFTNLNSGILQMSNVYKKDGGRCAFTTRKDLDLLSQYFSFSLCANHVTQLLLDFLGDYKTNQKKALGMIGEIHFLTTGFKALSSWQLVRTSRKEASSMSLGNLLMTGVVQQYGDGVPTVTYEGDNVVLMLQVIRSVLGSYQALMGGKTLKGSMEFLNKYQSFAVEQTEFNEILVIKSVEDFLLYADEILENFAFKTIQILCKKLQTAIMEEGVPMRRVLSEKLQTELIQTAVKIFEIINHRLALASYQSEFTNTNLQGKDKALLGKLLQLHKMVYIQDKFNDILQIGIIKYNDNLVDNVQKVKEIYYKDLIPELQYLYSQCLSEDKELSCIKDFGNITHKTYTQTAKNVTDICQNVQRNMLKLSKL